jgi:hypothetical protein
MCTRLSPTDLRVPWDSHLPGRATNPGKTAERMSCELAGKVGLSYPPRSEERNVRQIGINQSHVLILYVSLLHSVFLVSDIMFTGLISISVGLSIQCRGY